MTNGNCVLNQGKVVALHRTFETVPTMTNPTNFKVGTGNTTPSVYDTDLKTSVTIGGASSKALVSGYPIFDDANIEVINRGILLTTEANGNNLTEFGLVNTDASPVLCSRAVHTLISKSDSVQVVYIVRDKFI